MLAALALCSIAIIYYVSPTICCRRRKARPVSAEVINEYGDL